MNGSRHGAGKEADVGLSEGCPLSRITGPDIEKTSKVNSAMLVWTRLRNALWLKWCGGGVEVARVEPIADGTPGPVGGNQFRQFLTISLLCRFSLVEKM